MFQYGVSAGPYIAVLEQASTGKCGSNLETFHAVFLTFSCIFSKIILELFVEIYLEN